MKCTLTNHINAVKCFKNGAKQACPENAEQPSDKDKIAAIRLLVEETIEMANALGINIICPHNTETKILNSANDLAYQVFAPADIVEVADAAVDIMWVGVTGPMALCGISDKLEACLKAVDENNLLKIANGTLCPDTGKFIKPKDHPKVDLESIIDV